MSEWNGWISILRSARRIVVTPGRLAPVIIGVTLMAAPADPARAANVFINVITNAVTLSPTASDYTRDYVELTGASGIQVRIKTNDPVGMSIFVRCSDPSPRIALSDLLVRTLTPAGLGGAALTTYTPISATDQLLWSTRTSLDPFFNVNTDLRIRNLMNYSDSPAAGTTNHTNTIIYTAIAQ